MKIRIYISLIINLILLQPLKVQAAGSLFWGGSGTWSTASAAWGTVDGGPFATVWSNSKDVYFNVPNSTITMSSVGSNPLILSITANENVTFTAGTDKLATGNTTIPVTVASGKVFNLNGQDIATAVNTGIRKEGPGEIVLSGSGFDDFVLNAGIATISTVNSMGDGTLTLNGGVVAITGNTRTLQNTSITIGGDFTLGASTNFAVSGTKITFPAVSTSLGNGTTRTITLGGTGIYDFLGVISGVGSSIVLNATADGKFRLSGNNTYNGGTTISGGTLDINASGVLADDGPIILNGGTLRTGATVGYSETVGTLALTNNSTLNFGTGSHNLNFAASNGVSWTAGKTLTISAWTGSTGHLFVGNSNTGLTAGQLAQINFNGFSSGSTMLSTGEIVPGTPTLTADNSYINVDYNIDITFTDNPVWRAAVTAVKVDGTTLTPGTDYDLTAGQLRLKPSGGNSLITNTTVTNKLVSIEATDFSTATVNQTINTGAAAKLVMKTQPTAPATNGGVLGTMPAVQTKDQFNNNKTIVVDVIATVGAGSWTIAGNTTGVHTWSVVDFTALTASSNASVTGATITFTASGLTSVTSDPFNIPAPTPAPVLTAAVGATVDGAFVVTFTDVPAWRSAVTSITVDGTTLSPSAYSFGVGTITFTPSASTLLQTSGSKSIVVFATAYSNGTVTQAISAGTVSATNSTASIDANLQASATRTITCTAKDQYNNLVSGYVFKYDATITNANGTTAESYTINGVARTATTNDLSVGATNGSGVATFTATLPATIDSGDGVVIQVQMNNGTTNVGSDFGNVLIAQTITFNALASKVNGEAPFALTGTATSGLTVTYTSSDTNVATVSGATVTILTAGSTTITAFQAGDGSYSAAASVPQTLTITATPNTTITTGQDLLISNLTTSITADVTIQSGGKLTIDANKSINQITVESGARLVFSNTSTLTTVGNVVFKADKNGGSFSANIASGTLSIGGTVKFLKTMDNSQWYFMSFPCAIAVNDITFTAGGPYTLGTDYFIKYYDGAQRIENLATTSNWRSIVAGETLEANKGYIIGLANTIVVDRELNFPLVKATVQSETQRNISVSAYGDGVTTNTLGNTVAENHKGWNLIGHPYLSKYTGVNASVNYMTFYEGGAYNTYAKADVTTINPFTSYFIQADATIAANDVSFALAGRQSAPAAMRNDETDRVRIYLTTATGVDNTNLIIDSNQSPAYTIGQDMEKWVSIGTDKPQIYTSLNGIQYAFNALNLESIQDLPLNVYSKTTGNATISVDATNAPSLTQLFLTDNSLGTTTNLLQSNYSYTATAGTDNSRFKISVQRVGTNTIDRNSITEPIVRNLKSRVLIENILESTNITIFDAYGRMVNQQTAMLDIELKIPSTGIYIVQLQWGGKTVTKKVVVGK